MRSIVTRFNGGIWALCIGNSFSACSLCAQVLWVAAFVRSGFFTLEQVGWVASGELLLSAIVSIAVSACVRRIDLRRLAILASALGVVANLLCLFPVFWLVVIGRLLNGLAFGAVVACVYIITARRQDAQRSFALIVAVAITAAGVMYVLCCTIHQGSPPELFALLAAIAAASFSTYYWGSSTSLGDSDDEGQNKAAYRRAVNCASLFAALGIVSTTVALAPLSTYLVLIGNDHAFSTASVGVVLAAATPSAALGAAAARLAAERAGVFWPLMLSLLVVAVTSYFAVTTASLIIFALSWILINLLAGFANPYGMVVLSRADASGRIAGAAPALVLLAGSVGPEVGRYLINPSHFGAFAVFAPVFAGLGIGSYALAMQLSGR